MLIHTDPSSKPLPDSPSVVAHGTTAGYFPNNSHRLNHSIACTWGSSSVPVAGSATSRPSDAAVDAARGARGRARALGHGKRVAGWQRKEEETGRRRKEEKKRRGEKEKGRRK
jgi:hypothetical protein